MSSPTNSFHNGKVESPPMDTGSVNSSTGESHPTLNNEVEELQLSKVFEVLTEMVKKCGARLRQVCARDEVLSPIPLSYKKLDGDDNEEHKWEEGQRLISPPLEGKGRVPLQLMGELEISFELPNDYDRAIVYLNKMKIPVVGVQLNQYYEKTCQFSFEERLQGWKLECKSRSTGRLDMYYYHEKARKTFRSIKEVVNFMMYEAYPKRLSVKNGYYKDQEWTEESSSKSKKLKFGSIGIDHAGELNQVDAVKFFKDAYNNLLNYFDF